MVNSEIIEENAKVKISPKVFIEIDGNVEAFNVQRTLTVCHETGSGWPFIGRPGLYNLILGLALKGDDGKGNAYNGESLETVTRQESWKMDLCGSIKIKVNGTDMHFTSTNGCIRDADGGGEIFKEYKGLYDFILDLVIEGNYFYTYGYTGTLVYEESSELKTPTEETDVKDLVEDEDGGFIVEKVKEEEPEEVSITPEDVEPVAKEEPKMPENSMFSDDSLVGLQ